MTSRYEIWLTDDASRRLTILEKFSFVSYSRTTHGYGTLELGIPYSEIVQKIPSIFQPDWRIEIWRSPSEEFPLRLERIYFLRQIRSYERETDGVLMVVYYGRDGMDLLRRRHFIQTEGFLINSLNEPVVAQAIAPIDDMMKLLVAYTMYYPFSIDETTAKDPTRAYPFNEFLLQGNQGLGPTVEKSFQDRNILDVLKELKELSFTLNRQDPDNNRKIYFDVVEGPKNVYSVHSNVIYPGPDRIVFEFETFADQRGRNLLNGQIFSVENGNVNAPTYSLDHGEEINFVFVRGQGRGDSRDLVKVQDTARLGSSRWNRCELVREATFEPEIDGLTSIGNTELDKGKPQERLDCEFINTPGGEGKVRSLYGLDWDLGDLLPVDFINKRFECEVAIVYVSVDDQGKEKITGRTTVGDNV